MNFNDRYKFKDPKDVARDAVEKWDFADSAVIFHGLEECITGIDQFGYPIYDYIKMIEHFVSGGMTTEESEEWIDYNVLGVNAGIGFIIHYYE